MAVTSIWPISRNPSVVINYAKNPEKTVEKATETMAALHKINGVVEYAADEMKTEKRSFGGAFFISAEKLEKVDKTC